jgi:aminocarboxymuconate-semialdehyde decarboxylase
MRKIDVFTHISPPGYSEGVARVAGDFKDIGKRTRGVPMLHDLDVRFRVMDMFPGYQQVLSLPTPPIELFAKPSDAI